MISHPFGPHSAAFELWSYIEEDQRAFLRFGLRMVRETHDRLWDEAAAEPGDPDGPELQDVFHYRIDGLWQPDYEWMHAAAVLRDTVTNFELYLERARDQVLRLDGTSGRTDLGWRDFRDFFARLDVQIETPEIIRIRELRHLLVHQRGELRTAELRATFGATSTDELSANVVELGEDGVTDAMDQLAAVVRTADRAVWQHVYSDKKLASDTRRTHADLDGAARHIGYELQMVVAGALRFSERNEGIYPPRVCEATIDDALLEATLLHLRLLDEFLSGRSKHVNAMHARDWIEGYSASCLDSSVMRWVDAQVAHVSVIRAPERVWEPARYTLRCCHAFERFLSGVASERADRSPAFSSARENVEFGLAQLPRWVR